MARAQHQISDDIVIEETPQAGVFRRRRIGLVERWANEGIITEQELTAAMPGSASCLDRYEYAKHGACMGMTDDQYFDGSLALVEIVNDSALGAFVRAQRGRTVARRDLIAAFEESFGRGSGRALALVCGGPGNRLLTEIRVGIEAEHVDDFPARHSLASVAFGRCPARIELRRKLLLKMTSHSCLRI